MGIEQRAKRKETQEFRIPDEAGCKQGFRIGEQATVAVYGLRFCAVRPLCFALRALLSGVGLRLKSKLLRSPHDVGLLVAQSAAVGILGDADLDSAIAGSLVGLVITQRVLAAHVGVDGFHSHAYFVTRRKK